jgi:hypothetical protein
MTELSPAAQAIVDAADIGFTTFNVRYAAVLRAAAEIVAPVSYEDIYTDGRMLQYEKEDPIREKLLSIATELEAQ